jgi:beta-xylosidase/AraC-like DNA-binding protein
MSTAAFPFTLKLVKGHYWVVKKEDTIKLLLGLHGEIGVRKNGLDYTMRAEDLLIINAFESCEISFKEESLVVVLEIHRKEIERQLGIQWAPVFICNTMASEHPVYQNRQFAKIRAQLMALVSTYFNPTENQEFIICEKFFTLLAYLRSQFQQGDQPLKEIINEDIQVIVETVKREYTQPLSLEQLAKESYLSYNYLSKKFKDETGVVFREYVKAIRLEHAAEELRYSMTSVLKVALNNGFSSSKSFHKSFKERYGMTPKQFRMQKHAVEQPKAKEQWSVLDRETTIDVLAKYLIENDSDEFEIKKERQHTFSLAEPTNPFVSPKRILNMGKATNWLRAECQNDLAEALNGFCYEQRGAEYLTVFSDYQQNNLLFEYIMNQEKTPIIVFELPTLEDEVAAWYQQQCLFIRQLVKKFGTEELSKWYFEWTITSDSDQNYWFKRFYQELNAQLSQAKIGLCVGDLYFPERYHSTANFFSHLVSEAFSITFFSYHANPTAVVGNKEQLSIQAYQKHNFQLLQQLLSTYHLTGEIYLTDWDTLVGEGEIFAGTFFRAALFMKEWFGLANKVDGISVWLNSESYYPKKQGNSLSLYLVHSLKRPVYLALQLLDKLQGEIIYQNEQVFVCKKSDELRVLLTNPSYINPTMSINANYLQYQAIELVLTMQAIKPMTYLVKSYSLDKDHGGIYNDWLRLGGLSEIDEEMVAYLKKKIMLRFEAEIKEMTEESAIKEALSFNACRLLCFKPFTFD